MTASGDANPAEESVWHPTTFLRFEEALDTSMGTARIVTDAGHAYIKAMGNRQGPHPLACELVGTRLANWFGLPTLDFSLINIDDEVDEIPFHRGGFAATGPAFVTRAIDGHPWGGTADELKALVNPDDIGRLVVFDTWVSNCDRHPPDLTTRRPNYDNVLLEDLSGDHAGKLRLLAMDHSHCFTSDPEISRRIARIDCVKDERLYGLFPGFVTFVRQGDVEAAIERLRELEQDFVQEAVATIPRGMGGGFRGSDCADGVYMPPGGLCRRYDTEEHRARMLAEPIVRQRKLTGRRKCDRKKATTV